MSNSAIAFISAFLLIGLSISIFTYKVFGLSFPVQPEETFKSWYIELAATMRTNGYRKDPLEIQIINPRDTETMAVANSQALAPNFGQDVTYIDGINRVTLTKRTPENIESFLFRFSLFELDINEQASTPPKPAKAEYAKKNRISSPDQSTQILYEEIDVISKKAKELSAGNLSFTREIIRILKEDTELLSFMIENTNSVDAEALIVKILNANNIIARTANGFPLLKESTDLKIERWIEVFSKDAWRRIDYDQTAQNSKDKEYYRWWTGDKVFINAENARNILYTLSMKASNDNALMRSLWMSKDQESIIETFALQTLPLQQQLVLQVLLLLPLGALMVAFFRQVIGVQTFGTFMPVLIALAFRETGLVYGIIFFMTLIITGLLARNYIDKLRLLMVPRLSAVLTVIVMFIIAAMLITKQQDIYLGISVALFPVVIITMFIERMSTMIDEHGSRSAVIGCIGSIFVAALIYVSIVNDTVKYIMFTFPELLLTVLGCCLILGRYNGYKLTEYWRFRQIGAK